MIKRELTEFFEEYGKDFIFYTSVTLIVVLIIATMLFCVTIPIALAFLLSPWWLFLYLLTIPGLLTIVSALAEKGYV